MEDQVLAYRARSYSTGKVGRAICNARNHHFVADDVGGEELGAGELFFSGIAACAVNMVERLANADQMPLEWMDVRVEAYQKSEQDHREVTIYDSIRVCFEMWGVSENHAKKLVSLWKGR